jgi:hypothetical protein
VGQRVIEKIYRGKVEILKLERNLSFQEIILTNAMVVININRIFYVTTACSFLFFKSRDL